MARDILQNCVFCFFTFKENAWNKCSYAKRSQWDVVNPAVLQSRGTWSALIQKSFEQQFLRLVTAEGHALTDLTESLESLGIQDGDTLTALALQVKIAATGSAFALWCCGGSTLLTWGRSRLWWVTALSSKIGSMVWLQVKGTFGAFAAVLAIWVGRHLGRYRFWWRTSSKVQELRNVQQVHTSDRAFAAILMDGSIVAWGDPASGGDISTVRDQLRHVQHVQATELAFAAILGRRDQLLPGGDPDYGGWQFWSPRSAQKCAAGAGHICCVCCAPSRRICRYVGQSIPRWGLALKSRGSSEECSMSKLQRVVLLLHSWRMAPLLHGGNVLCLGDSAPGQLRNVQQLQATALAFAAILSDGSVAAFRRSGRLGVTHAPQSKISSWMYGSFALQTMVLSLLSVQMATVVTWGNPYYGGGQLCSPRNSSKMCSRLQQRMGPFAAILDDGSLVTWGNRDRGGDSSAVQDLLANLVMSVRQ